MKISYHKYMLKKGDTGRNNIYMIEKGIVMYIYNTFHTNLNTNYTQDNVFGKYL